MNTQKDENGNEKTDLMYPVGIPAFLALSRPYAFSRLETWNNHLYSALMRRGVCYSPTYSDDVCFWNISSRASVYDGLEIGPIAYEKYDCLDETGGIKSQVTHLRSVQ